MVSVFEKNQRRIIIDALAQDVGYSVNSRILHSVLITWGHDIALDKVHAHIAWLVEKKYITSEWVGDYVQVAKLTQRGLDLAEGRYKDEGVERKLPDEA